MLQILNATGGNITAKFESIYVQATITPQACKGNLKRSKIAALYVQAQQTILAQYEGKSWVYKPYPSARQIIEKICAELNNLQA